MVQQFVCQIVQHFGTGNNQSGLRVPQNQQGVSRFNAEQGPGFFRNDDLTPVSDSGGTEYPLLPVFTENMFTSGHILTS